MDNVRAVGRHYGLIELLAIFQGKTAIEDGITMP